MRPLKFVYLMSVVCVLLPGCKKEEDKKGKLSASLQKSETVSDTDHTPKKLAV